LILEHAILNVRPGESPAFRLAIAAALPLMTATPGFIGMEVRPCIESPDRFLLLVRWDTLEAHTVAFRGSDRYQAWREKLHRFYEPFPIVEHYAEPVASA
jgi:heme-degrading monooxygenase HmoA